MLKSKRILTDLELDTFLKLREESNTKAARYMKSLQGELFEIDEEYDTTNTRRKRSRDFKVTED